MSAPLRFLSISILAWAAVRATTLGAVPGFTVSHAKPIPLPPIVPTQLAHPAPADASDLSAQWAMSPELAAVVPAVTMPPTIRSIPYYLRYQPTYAPAQASYAAAPIAPRRAWSLANALSLAPGLVAAAAPAPATYSELPPLVPGVGQRSAPAAAPTAVPANPKLDRWQMSSWAVLRGVPQPGALANGGTLGGSQGGARVTYAVTRSIAASLRISSPIGGSTGAELAGGIRWVPLHSIPVAITAERRQSISPHGGRSDFALFAEAGLYRRPMPWRFQLDAYAQAGIVGLAERDLFADGALAFTRPIYGRFSAGLGMWGGYQPGLYRLDVGPRVSMRVRDNIRAHVDWRQRVVGDAQPASGPALTLAADF